MNATVKTLESITGFNDNLIKAFRRMILGINVELSEKGKIKYRQAELPVDKQYFITAINEDETITLECPKKHIFKGLKINDIDL